MLPFVVLVTIIITHSLVTDHIEFMHCKLSLKHY